MTTTRTSRLVRNTSVYDSVRGDDPPGRPLPAHRLQVTLPGGVMLSLASRLQSIPGYINLIEHAARYGAELKFGYDDGTKSIEHLTLPDVKGIVAAVHEYDDRIALSLVGRATIYTIARTFLPTSLLMFEPQALVGRAIVLTADPVTHEAIAELRFDEVSALPQPQDPFNVYDLSLLTCVPTDRLPELFRASVLYGSIAGDEFCAIPFQYPDDGCFASANRMSALLAETHGVECGKAWQFFKPPVAVRTPNHPHGAVKWSFHVAPAVLTQDGEVYVLDPTLLPHPVTLNDWNRSLGGAAAGAMTNRTAYQPLTNRFSRDVDLSRTKSDLADYAACLQLRMATAGPPPYRP